MTLEEKRELHKAISQILADAGINQTTLKEMVQEEISHKVDRSVEQVISREVATLTEKYGENFITYAIEKKVRENFNHTKLAEIVRNVLRDKVIKVILSNADIDSNGN
jgi:hypothetical protein